MASIVEPDQLQQEQEQQQQTIPTSNTNPITNNQIIHTSKNKKTPQYILDCAKRYRDRHPEKIKEYREKYKNEKNNKLSITELELAKLKKQDIITKYMELENKYNGLLNCIKQN